MSCKKYSVLVLLIARKEARRLQKHGHGHPDDIQTLTCNHLIIVRERVQHIRRTVTVIQMANHYPHAPTLIFLHSYRTQMTRPTHMSPCIACTRDRVTAENITRTHTSYRRQAFLLSHCPLVIMLKRSSRITPSDSRCISSVYAIAASPCHDT